MSSNINPSAQNGSQPMPQQPKKNSTSAGLIVFLVTVLIVAGGGFGLYWYLNQDTEADTELAAYEMLDGSETLEDYEAFMTKFPDSPHMRDVKQRFETLKTMYSAWNTACISCKQRDFEIFAKNYPNSMLVKVCEQKIDSLDWEDAKAKGDPESIEAYLRKHPNGRYSTEASESHSKIMDATATTEEKLLIEEALRGFYNAYGDNDAATVFVYITPTMKRFLNRENATKADVADIIDRTYNEHILSCKFVLNNDYKVKKETNADGEAVYMVSFSVDQHIERDNEGKTFGSYTANAVLTDQYKISSLTMKEISRKEQ
ncbi:MAG: hypothetical protein Q4D23_08335 [Bacteroidales bacterium]|nr:hypothetical protein [Bacteroidales bacterium]